MEDDEITDIVNKFIHRREYYKQRYHNYVKTDPEQVDKARERARIHYNNNKEKRKEYYQTNKTMMLAMNRYRYYKKNNNLDLYIKKYPEDYKLIIQKQVQVQVQVQEQVQEQVQVQVQVL